MTSGAIVVQDGKRYRLPNLGRFDYEVLGFIAGGYGTSEALRDALEAERHGASRIGFAVIHTSIGRLTHLRLAESKPVRKAVEKGELPKLEVHITQRGVRALELYRS